MTNYEISLVNAAKGGDGRAYEELYSHYYRKVFALAGIDDKVYILRIE